MAARSLRLERVREKSISATALLDHKLRQPYPLAPLDGVRRRRPSYDDEDDDDDRNPKKRTAPSSIKPAEVVSKAGKKGGWNDQLIFADNKRLEALGLMERLVLQHKRGLGEREAARKVLRPETATALRELSPQLCRELQRRIFAKIRKVVAEQHRKYERVHAALDKRGIFSTEVNAHRVHTKFLTALQKHIDIRRFEEECLADLETQEYDRQRAKAILRGVKAGAMFAKTKTVRANSAKNSDDFEKDKAFDAFAKWYAKRDRRALPATPLLAESFQLKPLRRPTIAIDLSDGRHTKNVPRFENSFLAAARPHANTHDCEEEEEEEEEEELPVTQPRPSDDDDDDEVISEEKKRKPPVVKFKPRRTSSLELASLQQRLERSWFDLRLTTAQKLDCLRKFASLEFAPHLPKAVDIWEQAADLQTRRTRILSLRNRLETDEAFGTQEFLALLDSDDTDLPDLKTPGLEVVTAKGHHEPLLDRRQAHAWLSSKLAAIDADLATLAAHTSDEIGTRIPLVGTATAP